MASKECVHEWNEVGEWPSEWPSGRPGVLVSVCDMYSCIVNLCTKCGKRAATSRRSSVVDAPNASAGAAWHDDVDDFVPKPDTEMQQLRDQVNELSARVKYLDAQHAQILLRMK